MLNIGFIDDHEPILLGLKNYFSQSFNVVFTTTKPSLSFNLIKSHSIDVLVIDLVFPDVGYIEYYSKLKTQFPDVRIISYSSLVNPLIKESLKQIGVFDLINKNEPISKLEEAIHRSMKSEILGIKKKKLNISLTPSEYHIVTLLARGKTTKEISDELNRSYKTIENHRGNILTKMQVHNVSELISKCYQIGILNISEIL